MSAYRRVGVRSEPDAGRAKLRGRVRLHPNRSKHGSMMRDRESPLLIAVHAQLSKS